MSYRSSKAEEKIHRQEANKLGLAGQPKLRTIKNKKLAKQLLEGQNAAVAEATRSHRNTNRNEGSRNELHQFFDDSFTAIDQSNTETE